MVQVGAIRREELGMIGVESILAKDEELVRVEPTRPIRLDMFRVGPIW